MVQEVKTPNNNSLVAGVVRAALAALLVLLVPFVAMQFSDEVNWSLGDFVVAGALLFTVACAYELVVRRIRSRQQRLVAGVLLFAVALVVWTELAVGIFD